MDIKTIYLYLYLYNSVNLEFEICVKTTTNKSTQVLR